MEGLGLNFMILAVFLILLSISGRTKGNDTSGKPAEEVIGHTRALYTCSDYESIYAGHSMCLSANEVCQNKTFRRGVTEDEKINILRLHNRFRSKVARGKEQRGAPGPQPKASNMMELVWNDELAAVAQAWAEQCPRYHDCYQCRKLSTRTYYVGQNMFFSSGYDTEVWKNAIQAFYNEVNDFPNHTVSSFGPLDNGKMIAHYTQLVWASTREIGCGAIYYDCGQTCKTYVCNYGPAGNYKNRPLYDVGRQGTKCPGAKSSKYWGLCAP